jgi:hypothetical protein
MTKHIKDLHIHCREVNMDKRFGLVIIAFLLLFVTTGCVKNCLPDDYEAFQLIADSPAEGSAISYNTPPTFKWHNNLGCKPQEYRIRLINESSGGSHEEIVDGDLTEFSSVRFMDLMDMHQEMRWYLYAYDKHADSSHLKMIGNDYKNFMTDGLCEANELVPPKLIEPENEIWKSLPYYKLEWSYPEECVPEFFKYELAADPNFTNIITSGITDWFWLYDDPIIIGGENYGRIISNTHVKVPDCARLYWRVEARRGNDSGGFSQPFRFTNAMDYSCWQNEVSIDAGLIKGYVFEDICPNTQPWLPDGVGIGPPCTFSEEFGVYGDGNRARGLHRLPRWQMRRRPRMAPLLLLQLRRLQHLRLQ